MIIYILKSLVLSVLFYGIYVVWMKKQKATRWKRHYIIITSLLSVLVPYMTIPPLITTRVAMFQQLENDYAALFTTFNQFRASCKDIELNHAKLFTAILFIGVLWGLLRIVLGFIVLKRIKENSTIETYQQTTVFFNESIESPFSFNKKIYIPAKLQQHEALPLILTHELAHITCKHSYEKLYFSMMQAICWFNPIMYLNHQESERLHDNEVDELLTLKVDKAQYIQEIIQSDLYLQTSPTMLVHSFYTYPSKDRTSMLNSISISTRSQRIVVGGIVLAIVSLFILIQTLSTI